MGSSTNTAAACTTRSLTVGIPRGQTLPSPLGMYTRRTGLGRYCRRLSSSARSANHCARVSSRLTSASSCPSTPAGPHHCGSPAPGHGPGCPADSTRHTGCRTDIGVLPLLSDRPVRCNFRIFSGVVIRFHWLRSWSQPSSVPSSLGNALAQVPPLGSPQVVLSCGSTLLRETPTAPPARAASLNACAAGCRSPARSAVPGLPQHPFQTCRPR